jgi:putative copper resistance protein D
VESAPGAVEVLSSWTFDPFWAAIGLGALVTYWGAVRQARRNGFPHPVWRASSFSVGAAVALAAVFSPVATYSRQLLWADFTGFLLLTMVAPPLMLLGAPLTLAFRASSRRRRRVLRRAYRSQIAAVATFPVATWLTFAVVTYLWQFTSLTEFAAEHQPVRTAQQLSLLLVGLLFWLPALAADPLRWRLPYPLRCLYVMVEMTHKGLFGGMFLSLNNPIHSDFAARAPAWAPNPMLDQRMAILILWIGGNLIFLAALIGLAAGWISYEQRNQHRTDARLERARSVERRRRAALEQVFDRPV